MIKRQINKKQTNFLNENLIDSLNHFNLKI